MAIEPSESERLSLDDVALDNDFRKVIEWIENFLCAPHADLGRLGDVCPFARTAMLKRSVDFFRNHSESVSDLLQDISRHLDVFQQSGANDDLYRCRIIVPAKIADVINAVEYVQKQLKPAFVERHMMIGQFFPNCEEPGLWNGQFRPLQAPIPLIAIRNMVPTDIAFLHGEARYVQAYLDKFGKRGVLALQKFEMAMEVHK